jgi:hypothetical protein
VFRDTSIQGQVLVTARRRHEANPEQEYASNEQTAKPPKVLTAAVVGAYGASEPLMLCPQCQTTVVYQEGCYICPECGWGACS